MQTKADAIAYIRQLAATAEQILGMQNFGPAFTQFCKSGNVLQSHFEPFATEAPAKLRQAADLIEADA